MKPHLLTPLFLWILVLPVQAASDRPSGVPDEAKWANVDRVVDGDTVYTKDGTKIRLHGIDTPERDQPYGQQATRALDGLIKTKFYVLEKDTDRYGRFIRRPVHTRRTQRESSDGLWWTRLAKKLLTYSKRIKYEKDK